MFVNVKPTPFSLIVSTLALLLIIFGMGMNFRMLVSATRGYRQYFTWSMFSLLLGLIPTLLTIIFWRQRPHAEPNNFTPFTFFAQMFFIPAGFMMTLIGRYLMQNRLPPNE